MVLSGIALVLLAGCGGPGGDDMSAGEMSAFMLPPPGTTGTPADDVTDPALNNLPNSNPTVVTNWGPLPDGRIWGSTAGTDIGPDGHVWVYDRCGGGLDGGCDTN